MRSTFEKVKIFRDLFSGLHSAYGTYNLSNGKAYQVKRPVSDKVVIDHLSGKTPFGFYPLMHDTTRIVVADFDTKNRLHPIEFVNSARHYLLSSHIERSKSKGYHVWIFFENKGVPACKARLVVRHILEEIEMAETEIFPKQDLTSSHSPYGNFINAPLFGALVPMGKTVFIEPYTFNPYPDQWDFLDSIQRHSERDLDDIIEMNSLDVDKISQDESKNRSAGKASRFGLPVCAQRMLDEGVTQYQRVSCFRLAVHLKRVGLPQDAATAVLKSWARKNRPAGGKQIISESEIIDQTAYAYAKDYRGYGCSSAAVSPFCDSDCSVKKGQTKRSITTP